MTASAQPWPTELRVADGGKLLRVSFDDGSSCALTAELLRVSSPSAEVQGHAPGERKVLGGKRNVAILSAEPVGNYAVKLTFSDGHATGLFTWAFLHDLGSRSEAAWATYLDELAARCLSRG
jgi:DUF971 family protein